MVDVCVCVYQDSCRIKHVCVCLSDVFMMGFHVASGLVSVILQVIVDSIVLFCYLLFCSAIQTYSIMYTEDRNTLTQKS